MTKQVTVAELVTELLLLPQDLLVRTEGCDCYGPCSGASLVSGRVRASAKDPDYVLIERVYEAQRWAARSGPSPRGWPRSRQGRGAVMRIDVRVTKRELEAVANYYGMSISDVVRALVLQEYERGHCRDHRPTCDTKGCEPGCPMPGLKVR